VANDYSYRNLVLWQRSQQLAVQVISIIRRLPNDWGNAVIARQIIASVTSISANIAEGHARFTWGAHSNHLSIARGSAAETDSWIDLLLRLRAISSDEEASLHQECLWIMQSLKSKILDLEQAAKKPTRKVGEQNVLYAIRNEHADVLPLWPFIEADYSFEKQEG
jgi:four helix bundle protein